MATHLDAVPTVLPLTLHPLQRAGARAVVCLSGRGRVEEVTEADLDRVSVQITEDAVRAALAPKGSRPYDWWKILFALYPNSKATHGLRPRGEAVLAGQIGELFAPEVPGGRRWPCTWCERPTGVCWGKTDLPLYGSVRFVNELVAEGPPGWPVCRACRIAAWAIPYGAWATAREATVLAGEDPAVEEAFAGACVRRATRIQQDGFAPEEPTGAAGAALQAVQALREAAATWTVPEVCGVTLYRFRNDNENPTLTVSRARRGLPAFLATVAGNAPLRAVWEALEAAATEVDRRGRVLVDGPAELTSRLFESDGYRYDLLDHLHAVLLDPPPAWRVREFDGLHRLVTAWLAHAHDHVPDVVEVAELLAAWIAQKPAARADAYTRAAASGYQLGQLLLRALDAVARDGLQARMPPAEQWQPLLGADRRSFQARVLLHAHVVLLLCGQRCPA